MDPTGSGDASAGVSARRAVSGHPGAVGLIESRTLPAPATSLKDPKR